jgi:hypothetical protein
VNLLELGPPAARPRFGLLGQGLKSVRSEVRVYSGPFQCALPSGSLQAPLEATPLVWGGEEPKGAADSGTLGPAR